MQERELRKQLTIMAYGLIFKKIYPTMDGSHRIGNIEYAAALNKLIKERTQIGYDLSDYAYLDLIHDDAPSGHPILKESNFNNWVNGTSNPKTYAIINAILEYTAHSSVSEEKTKLLAYELAAIIKHEAFSAYTDGHLANLIQEWAATLVDIHHPHEAIRILKDLLYLLKDKNRHLSYILRSQSASTPQEDIKIKPIFIIKALITKRAILISCTLAPLLILGILLIKTLSPDKDLNDLSMVQEDINPVHQVYAEDKPVTPLEEVQALPSSSELFPPTILTPDTQELSSLAYGPISLNWTAVPSADHYDLTLVNKKTMEPVLELKDLKETFYQIDSKNLVHGESYLVYVFAGQGLSSSEAAILTFKIDALQAPHFIAPNNMSDNPMGPISVQWEPVAEADTYTLVVTDISRWVKVFEKSHIESSTYQLDESIFLPGGTYRIYLSSENSGVVSAPNYLDITINNLATPNILNVNNTTLSSKPFGIQWDPVDYANSYQIEIMETTTWESVYLMDGITEEQVILDPSLFKVGGTYRLYLFARLGNQSSQPDYLDFTAPELLSPMILSPMANDTLPLNTFSITWEANPYASHYKLVVSDIFIWEPILTLDNIEGTTAQVDKNLLTLDHPYRIYLFSCSGDIEAPPTYLDFRVEGLKVPNILSPKTNTTFQDQKVLVEWEPSQYISTYKVTVTSLSSWDVVYENKSVMAEEILLDKTVLKAGDTYRIYVQSILGDMESAPMHVDVIIK